MIALFLKLFYTFFKLGLFGFGGGYAMLSMIQGEVVRRYAWIELHEFTDIVAISQMTPGPIGINTATYVGYMSVINAGGSQWLGILGSAISTFALVLPSFILMFTVSKFLLKHKNNPVVESVFKGLRPTVVGLVASAALILMTEDNFGNYNTDRFMFIASIIIFLVSFIAVSRFKVHPILMIVLAGIAGYILY